MADSHTNKSMLIISVAEIHAQRDIGSSPPNPRVHGPWGRAAGRAGGRVGVGLEKRWKGSDGRCPSRTWERQSFVFFLTAGLERMGTPAQQSNRIGSCV